MFDVGFWEFALIAIITLLVVGPERMPEIAKKAGRYAGKIKKFISQIQTDINTEFEADKIKAHLSLEDKDDNIIETFEEGKGALDDIKNDIKNDNNHKS